MEAEEFVGVKSFKARGKRVTTFAVEQVEELEPTRQPGSEVEEVPQGTDSDPVPEEPVADESQQDALDEMTGQLHMFDE